MKPDGVTTAALDPVETLGSNPVNDAAPTNQDPIQAATPEEEALAQQPVEDMEQVKPQAEKAKETPATKTNKKSPTDPKTKMTNKAVAKTKPSPTNAVQATTGSRNTSQSRLSNGMSKPQTNGMAKKTTAVEKKSTQTTAPLKNSRGTTGTLPTKSTTKVGEKKATGAAPTNSGVKPVPGTTATKKPSPTTPNGVKTSTTTAATKKPPATKPPSAAPTKPSSTASPKTDKPPVTKTTRPTTGTSTSRPAPASTRPLASSTTKSSPSTAKPAPPKTPSTATKPAASKQTSTTPSGGKSPASQTLKNATPVKKDVSKPATPAAKKPAASPLTRPVSSTKSAKPETPKSASKSDSGIKKTAATQAADTKTRGRPKTDEIKQISSKNISKTPISKPSATKTSSPKKTIGSSTPTPVKRGPKAATEPAKEITAVVAATAAGIGTVAACITKSNEPEPAAQVEEAPEAPLSSTAELMTSKTKAIHEQEPVPEQITASVSESIKEPLLQEQEPIIEITPEPARETTPEPIREATPEPIREATPEPIREATPEPIREATPEPIREATPEPVREATPEPVREPTPEPIREPNPDLVQEATPKPVQEQTSEPIHELTSEPVQEPIHEITPEPVREPNQEPVLEGSSEHSVETLPQPILAPELEGGPLHELFASPHLAAQLDFYHLDKSANECISSLGTTVMSPPCSPQGSVSPVREPKHESLLDMHVQSDPWDGNQPLPAFSSSPQSSSDMVAFQEREEKETMEVHGSWEDREEEEQVEQEEKEKPLIRGPTPPSTEAFSMMTPLHMMDVSPMGDFTSRDPLSPHENEDAVEKAEEEINEDDDVADEDEDEEQRRLHQLSSMVTDMSSSQPSEEFQVRSPAFGSSAGWHGDNLLSGMDSEDVSSCTSSRQQGVSDLSSTQHTAILEGTQSSDALVDSSLRGSEGDGNLMGSPNVETLANEEEEDDDEEDERVDDMDLSSERAEEHHKVFEQQEQDEDDEDVEMHSEGVIESCENVDEDDFNEEEHLDNLNYSGPIPNIPTASSWDKTNPFFDHWAQPASLLSASSPSPVSDHGAAESETPMESPAQAYMDSSAPSLAPQPDQESKMHHSDYEQIQSSEFEEGHVLPAASAVGMSQIGALSGTGLAAHSGSETSTPEELHDYDSSSGVESRSDKHQTPVPASIQPDMEQDLGIHLEKGDGEEEEAETLPADEVLGTGPPTAPASAPSSPSSSGDEASDTEGELQINDPEAAMVMDENAGFESPPPTCSLPALEEDEEAVGTLAGEGEEDGGGATPQSANSVASYGFDCTTSNSNAHSMAESCGKSPGIFSLENEEQLPEEAKDPSLIKELTVPSAAAAQVEDLLCRSVDLMPLDHPGDIQPGLDDYHYLMEGKDAADHLEEVEALHPHHVGAQHSEDDSQPSYFSTISDKTDSFLAES
ncbi:proteoglycan 4 isoform X2 [Thalassophryne amazonica]|uniref:proteoglycan 4 isoform X2 n=1 Tax=Thalassophryne amazonica TaxID=390379 RepID=UPI001470CC3C|nr:proteoglycan 4 isoform X2 [Thalassophryne amazonica]